jgi:FkbM family methyltransferase
MKHIQRISRLGLYFLYKRIRYSLWRFLQKDKRLELLKNFLPYDPVIIEAGTSDGYDTLRLAKYWPKGHVYAFEPVPSLFSAMKERTSLQKNVTAYQYALSDKNGEAMFYINGEDPAHVTGASTLLRPNQDNMKMKVINALTPYKHMINVKTMRLDSWVKQEGIKKIDLLWLDMEGAEPMVLKASESILDKVKVICTEVNTEDRYSGSILYSEFKQWLEGKGFRVVDEKFNKLSGDVIFVKD